MKGPLRIVVAEDERNMCEYLQQCVRVLGHEVAGTARTGEELVARCADLAPDLVITDIKMPDMDGIEAAGKVYEKQAIPVIIVSAHYDPEFIDRAGRNHIAAYLVKPIKHEDLGPAIGLAMSRFAEFQALSREAADLRQALEDRKLIERAKGILMRRSGLDEESAFRRLQQLASEKHQKMRDIAQMILTAEEAFQGPARKGPGQP